MTNRARSWRRWPLAQLLAWLLAAGCAPLPPTPAAEAAYGIQFHSLRWSAHGELLDLRYRVSDARQAAFLLDPKKTVQLIDDKHQARLGVPSSPVIGAMRQTARNGVVYTDRDYFILFANPGRAVQPGDSVQLAVDGLPIARLTVH